MRIHPTLIIGGASMQRNVLPRYEANLYCMSRRPRGYHQLVSRDDRVHLEMKLLRLTCIHCTVFVHAALSDCRRIQNRI